MIQDKTIVTTECV